MVIKDPRSGLWAFAGFCKKWVFVVAHLTGGRLSPGKSGWALALRNLCNLMSPETLHLHEITRAMLLLSNCSCQILQHIDLVLVILKFLGVYYWKSNGEVLIMSVLDISWGSSRMFLLEEWIGRPLIALCTRPIGPSTLLIYPITMLSGCWDRW